MREHVLARKGRVPSRGRLVLSAASALMWFALQAAPAEASSVWDARDVGGHLDLRWVGIYQEDPDTVRLAISFWGPVRRWMLGHPLERHMRWVSVRSRGFNENLLPHLYGSGRIYFNVELQRWVLDWVDDGLVFRLRVSHPNPYLFQIRFRSSLAERARGFVVRSCDRLRRGEPPRYCMPRPPDPSTPFDRVPTYPGNLDP